MFKLDPSISIKELSAVAPGSFVHWGEDRIGICVVSAADRTQQHAVIVYKPEEDIFEYAGGEWPTVLAYETEVEIKPDLQTFVGNTSINTARPLGELYIEAGKPFLALKVGHSLRFVDLATGEMRSPPSWGLLAAFRGWSVYVPQSDGTRHKILEVGAWGGDVDLDSVDPA